MNTVSPVTEQEVGQVQSFFERISTTIVAHAAQARELGELRARMDEVSTRLNSLQSESENLRRDLTQAWEYNARLEKDKDAAVRDAAEQREYAALATQETAKARQEYEQRQAQDQYTIETKQREIAELQERLLQIGEERSRWQERSNRYEALTNVSDGKLKEIQGRFNEMSTHVRSLFEPKEVPQPVEVKERDTMQDTGHPGFPGWQKEVAF